MAYHIICRCDKCVCSNVLTKWSVCDQCMNNDHTDVVRVLDKPVFFEDNGVKIHNPMYWSEGFMTRKEHREAYTKQNIIEKQRIILDAGNLSDLRSITSKDVLLGSF